MTTKGRVIGDEHCYPGAKHIRGTSTSWRCSAMSHFATTAWRIDRSRTRRREPMRREGNTSCLYSTFRYSVGVGPDQDGGSSVFTTTNPTGGAGAWHRYEVPGVEMQHISCASSQLCVTVQGRVPCACRRAPSEPAPGCRGGLVGGISCTGQVPVAELSRAAGRGGADPAGCQAGGRAG